MGIRDQVFEVGRAVDRRGGVARIAVRTGFGAIRSVRDTAKNRHLTTLHWSPRDGRWHHRWPQGRAVDERWWRTPHDWATEGGLHDMDDLLWRHYKPKPGDTVVDVGAGHGGETFYLAPMVGQSGRVIAIEAAPAPFQRLEELVRLNGWPQVEVLQVALSDRSGVVTMSDEENWIAGNIYEGGSIEVPALTLDELCEQRGIGSIDWLKMNIEGAEKDAVKGMEQMVPRIRHLTISCHDFLGTEWGRSKAQVTAWLETHGFTVVEHGAGPAWAVDYIYAWR